jgi:energy-coupling factor transporter ATP-binding protein EcfA2
MNGRSLYAMKGLSFSYVAGQAAALSIPGLEIGEGDCLALAGPNGSGKTTFLKLLDDLLPGSGDSAAFSGELLFRGEPVRRGEFCFHPRSLRKEAIYMHQHPYVLSGTVSHNLRFACRARGITGDAAEEASARALALVGMESFATRGQKGLSGGEAQRLALARVIVSGAKILLLDEPTASTDAASSERILEALAKLAESGTTIIFSTHEQSVIERIARRTLEFDRGAIVSDTRRQDVKKPSSR